LLHREQDRGRGWLQSIQGRAGHRTCSPSLGAARPLGRADSAGMPAHVGERLPPHTLNGDHALLDAPCRTAQPTFRPPSPAPRFSPNEAAQFFRPRRASRSGAASRACTRGYVACFATCP
jgi:hypothetical protein